MGPGTYRKLTPADEEKIADLYREGIIYQEIARRLSVSLGRVWQALKRQGAELNRAAERSRAWVTECCPVCGQEFTHYRSKPQKYCRLACSRAEDKAKEWSHRRAMRA